MRKAPDEERSGASWFMRTSPKSMSNFNVGRSIKAVLTHAPREGGTLWVIDNGFLYEIVTHDVFAPWLDTILRTWHFL